MRRGSQVVDRRAGRSPGFLGWAYRRVPLDVSAVLDEGTAVTQTPQITIPADLLPADGRFGAGPSKVRAEQVAALAEIAPTYLGTSHRQKTVRSQVARLRSGLADLFDLPEGYEVVLGNGGSTAFWEVAAFGLVRDRAQFLTFGEFGSKFAQAVKDAPFLGEPTVHKADPGSAPSFTAEDGVDVYATPHNETSTGVAITPNVDLALQEAIARHQDPDVAFIPEGPYVVPVFAGE